MAIPLDPVHYFEYLLRRDVTKLYLSVAIRNLGLGMVLLFEPIYMYLFFDKSLPLTLMFFAVMFGLFGLLAPFAGKLMAKLGTNKTILLSVFFYFGYYLSLFFLPQFPWLVPISLGSIAVAMTLFWPAFHTDFARFSSQKKRGGEVGKLNVMSLVPMVASPAIGGWVLASFGYPVLFVVVLSVLLASSIPLFYSRETHEVYTDSYEQVWRRAFKKENIGTTIGFVSWGLEFITFFFAWPLFLFLLAINFDFIGGIASFALIASAMFMLYVGKLSDTADRTWLMNVGAVWTAISWVLKFFVRTPFDALLAHTLYRVSLSAANVPFQTYFYEKAAAREKMADEFIIYRETVMNVSRFFYLGLLALVFFLFPHLPINAIFLVSATFALGLMFMGKLPKISLE